VKTDHCQANSRPTTPLHQFREAVAQRLQKVPFGWAGEAGYRLASKYGDLIEQYWQEGELVDDTAHAVHRLHMARPQRVNDSTRATLELAGCLFERFRR
jgi:hypothetical protein